MEQNKRDLIVKLTELTRIGKIIWQKDVLNESYYSARTKKREFKVGYNSLPDWLMLSGKGIGLGQFKMLAYAPPPRICQSQEIIEDYKIINQLYSSVKIQCRQEGDFIDEVDVILEELCCIN